MSGDGRFLRVLPAAQRGRRDHEAVASRELQVRVEHQLARAGRRGLRQARPGRLDHAMELRATSGQKRKISWVLIFRGNIVSYWNEHIQQF